MRGKIVNFGVLILSDFLVRIYYEDTDCGGIVYHTNYIKYCERARSEIFFGANAMPNTNRIGLVVRKLNAEFLDSAKLGDLLQVKTRIVKLGQTSLTLAQEIYKSNSSLRENPQDFRGNPQDLQALRSNHPPCEKVAESSKIFQCEVKLACIDIERKKIAKIPSEILAILQTQFLRISNGK